MNKWYKSLLVGTSLYWLYISAATAQGSADNGSSASLLQEITVTATRREEPLSKVPESIAALTAEEMDKQGIRYAADVLHAVPGVDLQLTTTSTTQTNISIRGVSSTSGAATTGIYLDDTPIQIRSIGNDAGDSLPDIFDISRVEVLRGPQGTLFGAGAEGGAIRFISTEPGLNEWSKYERMEIATIKDGGISYEAGGAIGGPIAPDTLGFRISAHYRHDGGFLDRIPYPDDAGPDPPEYDSNWSESKSVRAALTWMPAPSLKITPSIYYRDEYTNDKNYYWLTLSSPSNNRYISGNGQPSPDDNKSSLESLRIDWQAEFVELIANTSYFSRTESNFSDWRVLITNTFGDGQPPYSIFAAPGYYDDGLFDNVQSNWTQELRLQSSNPNARLTWVTGMFYADDKQSSYQNLQTPYFDLETGIPDAAVTLFGTPLLNGQYLYEEEIVTHDKQLAAFAEANLHLTDALKAIAGYRVARTELDYFDTRNGPITDGPGQDSGKHTEYPKTPKLGLSYQVDTNHMIYATVADGFRIGGVNNRIPANNTCTAELGALGLSQAPETYNSDRVRSYELGAKDAFLNGNLRLASSVYRINWTNIIQPIDLVNCGFMFTTNLGKAVSKGADVQIDLQATAHLLTSASIGYDDARYTQTIRDPDATANTVTSGWTLGQTPWTVVLATDYSVPIRDGLESYFRADLQYHSRNNGLTSLTDPNSLNYDPTLRPNPGLIDLKLRTGIRFHTWDVSAYIDNATNSHPILNLSHDAVGGQIYYATPLRPITVGITAVTRM